MSEALVVAERLRARRRSTGKSKLSGSTRPLDRPPTRQPTTEIKNKTFGLFKEKWVSSAKDLSEGEQLVAVREAIRVFSLLPKESKYAQHRLKLLHKIEDILTQKRHANELGGLGAPDRAACLELPGCACCRALARPVAGFPVVVARSAPTPGARGMRVGRSSRAMQAPAPRGGLRFCRSCGPSTQIRREERGEQTEAELQSLLSQLKL